MRRDFWNLLAILKYRTNRPATIPVPVDEGQRIGDVSFASQFPGIPIHNIRVADRVPADEASRLKYYFYEFQVAMYRLFSPMHPDLPSIDEDPRKAVLAAYTRLHRRLFPAPQLPEEYEGEVDLGHLAVAGPYAGYLERAPEGGYHWDLRHLARYEHHRGLRSLGVRVLFRPDEQVSGLRAVEIDCELGQCRPGDPDWGLAKKIALCAVTNHVSLVRHFNWVHLAAGGPFAIATRNCLGADHPLRRLLWPHMFGTQYSNQIATKGQMARGGDFETIFSFTHAGMCKLYEDSYSEYDIVVLDPARDAERRGIRNAGFDTPALLNQEALFDVMHAHTSRYMASYYSSDDDLRADAAAVDWMASLDRLVPNGIRGLSGPVVTIGGTARMIAALLYLATVQHEVLGTGLWNYQMWTHVQPVRVYEDMEREPVDVYQRLVNANFNLNVRRAPLLQDFSYLALDARGADAFRTFKKDLEALQNRLEAEPFTHWKVYPRKLEANINA
ncbi:lipoxygenase family protein [Geodermatophilus maliterrae]|uniref:Lipoxygenase family protein n=1 Tax=Geodermatophilus maliterrae TaxID=3162531 RepID=A0ABV3XEX9_9ACTN